MTFVRLAILILGPILLVGASHLLTASSREAAAPTFEELPPPPDAETPAATAEEPDPTLTLQAQCLRAARHLEAGLSTRCHAIVRAPFVIAGDRKAAELNEIYRKTIQPVARALSASYFDRAPDAPILMVMLSDEETYRREARRLDNRQTASYSGYYERNERRVVVNLATGDGTLAHELTHALAHFDFPSMPEWFDEGLASLHEESEFANGDLELKGLSNWRLGVLREAQKRKSLPSLALLLNGRSFRGSGEGLSYAMSRYLCLYLQERHLLGRYYKEFRGAAARDPSGAATLCRVLQKPSLAHVDQEFRSWLKAFNPAAVPRANRGLLHKTSASAATGRLIHSVQPVLSWDSLQPSDAAAELDAFRLPFAPRAAGQAEPLHLPLLTASQRAED